MIVWGRKGAPSLLHPWYVCNPCCTPPSPPRSPELGGSWVPVFDAVAEAVAGEVYWPVGLSATSLTSIVCPKAQPHPQV